MRPSPNPKGIIMIRILKAIDTLGSADIREIKDAVPLSISRVRELVKQAVSRGLVEGSSDADDIMVYELTLEGREFLDPEMDDEDNQDEQDEQDDAEGLPAALEEPAEEPEAPVKAKRVILNPQPVIDKKTALLAEAGFTLTYASRTWTIQSNETGLSFSFDSRTLASVKAAEIVDYANTNMPVEAPAAAQDAAW